MKKNLYAFIRAMIALALGAAVYLLFREDTFLHTGLSAQSVAGLADAKFFMAGFVRYHLCDLLWGFALCTCLSIPLTDRWAMLITVACGSAWELAQRMSWLPGTGDMVDCFMYLIGVLIAVIINTQRKR